MLPLPGVKGVTTLSLVVKGECLYWNEDKILGSCCNSCENERFPDETGIKFPGDLLAERRQPGTSLLGVRGLIDPLSTDLKESIGYYIIIGSIILLRCGDFRILSNL